MTRRLLVNLSLAFIVFPAVLLLAGYFARYILKDYTGFTGDFWGFTEVTLQDCIRGISWWMLLGVLLPYNAIVYYYKKLKQKEIRFIYKILIFLLIEIFTLMLAGHPGYFFNSFSLTLKLVLAFSVMSIVIVSLHEYFVEKKEIELDSSD